MYTTNNKFMERTNDGFIYTDASCINMLPTRTDNPSKLISGKNGWERVLSEISQYDKEIAYLVKLLIKNGHTIYDRNTKKYIDITEDMKNPTLVIYETNVGDKILCICDRHWYAEMNNRYYDLAQCFQLIAKNGQIICDSSMAFYRTMNDRIKERRISRQWGNQWININLNHEVDPLFILAYYNMFEARQYVLDKCRGVVA